MGKELHIVVSISGHGLGHVGQTGPLIHTLHRKLPSLKVTIRSPIAEAVLRSRIKVDFDYAHVESDFGVLMKSPLEVDVERTAAAYRTLHADWARHLDQIEAELAALRPDMVVANVAYADLAAAANRGVPAIAMSCLNWADLYDYYCGDRPEGEAIHRQMLQAYNSTEVFLQAVPTMPMENISSRHPIGVVAPIGVARRPELAALLRLSTDEKLVLVTLGGMAHRFNTEHWPASQGVRWIVPAEWEPRRPDIAVFEHLGLSFTDVLRSCDALVGKPGYGSFTTAACNGVPVLYVERWDWPEQSYLIEWLTEHGRCRRISVEQLLQGNLRGDIDELLQQPPMPSPQPNGAEVGAHIIAERLAA